jgi:hypothetical protein
MKKGTILFLAVNLAALLRDIFYFRSALNLAKLEERGYFDFGDSIGFLATVAPLLLFCLLLNACWAIKSWRDIAQRKDYQASKVLVAVAAIWVGAHFTMRWVATSALNSYIPPGIDSSRHDYTPYDPKIPARTFKYHPKPEDPANQRR